MGILRKKEMVNMSEKELSEKLKDLKFELMKNNAQRATSQNTGKIKEIKKTIARIVALLKKKQQK